MSDAITTTSGSRIARLGWTVLLVICVLYAGFAVAAAFGLAEAHKVRGDATAFFIHALIGSATLVTGILQFLPAIRRNHIGVHRASGRIYVITACLTAIGGIVTAAAFDIGIYAKFSFYFLGFAWLSSTVLAFVAIRARRIGDHRNWMIRSFALCLAFFSFSIWGPALAGMGLSRDTTYVVGVTLGWALNLGLAELWIRFTRAQPA